MKIPESDAPFLSEDEAAEIIRTVIEGYFDYYDLMALTEAAYLHSLPEWRKDIMVDRGGVG